MRPKTAVEIIPVCDHKPKKFKNLGKSGTARRGERENLCETIESEKVVATAET